MTGYSRGGIIIGPDPTPIFTQTLLARHCGYVFTARQLDALGCTNMIRRIQEMNMDAKTRDELEQKAQELARKSTDTTTATDSNPIAEAYAQLRAAIEANLPSSREKALALTNLEQSILWAKEALGRSL